jgi:uncharacterized metal-binding protein
MFVGGALRGRIYLVTRGNWVLFLLNLLMLLEFLVLGVVSKLWYARATLEGYKLRASGAR